MHTNESAENYLETILVLSKLYPVVRSIDIVNELLTNWLIGLGVSKGIAEQDACRIEHILSSESFDAIKKHITL